ncbi:MAG TPA: ABC transporter substrate-binding protein [Streptosporangiaceae bacterium]|nr:ABC transporter substrate-binding protein [Streptosporangiaceae bacterium]
MRYLAAAAAAAALLVAGCTSSPGNPGQGAGSGSRGPGSGSGTPRVTVRLGYVADVTQAPAIVGIREGLFTASLGRGTAIRPVLFATEGAEAAALAAGKLDAAYASPDTILAVLAAHRASPIVVISGASAAGAELVISRRLGGPSALSGHTIAVPAAGGTQDVTLRGWLASRHLSTGTRPGVAVTAIAQGPAVVAAFRSGRIAGAFEPAPWDLELAAAGGRILTGDAGPAATTRTAAANLVVTRRFLDADSAAVYGLLRGQVEANDFLRRDFLQSTLAIQAQLAAAGQPVSSSLLALAMAQVTFTDDPLGTSLAGQARQAAAEGLAPPTPVPAGLYDIAPLDLVLRDAGEPPVTN